MNRGLPNLPTYKSKYLQQSKTALMKHTNDSTLTTSYLTHSTQSSTSQPVAYAAIEVDDNEVAMNDVLCISSNHQ